SSLFVCRLAALFCISAVSGTGHLTSRSPIDLFSFLIARLAPMTTLFPYTTLFRSRDCFFVVQEIIKFKPGDNLATGRATSGAPRSEEHTSELQSRFDLVCRLLLEKKKEYASQLLLLVNKVSLVVDDSNWIRVLAMC